MKEQRIINGRCWVFGDDVSTDDMLPGHVFSRIQKPDMTSKELGKFCMETIKLGWSKKVKPGDILIAGSNFGCGSSRPAALSLRALGIVAVVANSIARVFYRNSINLALPVLGGFNYKEGCFEDCDQVVLSIENGSLKNLRTGNEYWGIPLMTGSPPDIILKAGGLMPYMLDNYRKCFNNIWQETGATE